MLKVLGIIILILASFYILLCIFLYFYQECLLFFPSVPYLPHYEKILANKNLRNIQLQTSDGVFLDGWMQLSPEKKVTILYFGWNADETSYFVEKYHYQNANIVSFNYRGYGRSTGKPSEKAIFADALLQYSYLTETLKIKPENIIVMGRSLGTGVATYLASQRQVGKVILITPYDSVESVSKEIYFFVPVSLLLTNRFDSLKYASLRKNTLLCIYAGRDTTIPNHHTENLLTHWNGHIDRILIPEAMHDNIYEFQEVHDSIERFLHQK